MKSNNGKSVKKAVSKSKFYRIELRDRSNYKKFRIQDVGQPDQHHEPSRAFKSKFKSGRRRE
jgi:hypothetical protein